MTEGQYYRAWMEDVPIYCQSGFLLAHYTLQPKNGNAVSTLQHMTEACVGVLCVHFAVSPFDIPDTSFCSKVGLASWPLCSILRRISNPQEDEEGRAHMPE